MQFLIQDPLRPKEISNCPSIIKLLIERSLDADPAKRPTMRLIYEIMEHLNNLINTDPIKPLISTEMLKSAASNDDTDGTSGVESSASNVERTVFDNRNKNG